MAIFGDVESFVSSLYPYRWLIAGIAGVALVAAAATGLRRGWHHWALAHRLAIAIVAVPVVALSVPVGNYLLSPLWERSRLEEASPLAVQDSPTTVPAQASAAAGPTPLPAPAALLQRSGQFRGADDFHFGRGTALIIETSPGTFVLRVEEFSVRNGPDLFVYLSPDEDGFGEGAVNLGKLKATDGAFNYEIPAGVDVSKFKSAIVWCKQFSTLFAVAPLGPAM